MSLSYTFIYFLKVRKICKSLSEKGMNFRERMSVLCGLKAMAIPFHGTPTTFTPSVIHGIEWRASYSFGDIAINFPFSFIWYRSWKPVVLSKDTELARKVAICGKKKTIFFFFLILAWCSFGFLEQVAFKEKRVAFHVVTARKIRNHRHTLVTKKERCA